MKSLLEDVRALFAGAVERPAFTVTDNFFQAGGDSLAAAEILARIDDELGVELAYKDFLEAPTPARLVLTILVERARHTGGDVADEIAQLSEQDAAVLVAELEQL